MTPGAIDGARGMEGHVDRTYRANVRFGGFSSGELVTISDDRAVEYEDLIDKDWLTEVRTPQGRLADLAADGQEVPAGDTTVDNLDEIHDALTTPDPAHTWPAQGTGEEQAAEVAEITGNHGPE